MPVGVIDDPLYSNLVLINFALSCKFIVGISTLYSNLVLINFVGVVDDVSSVILYIPIWYLLIVDIPAEFAVYLVTLYSNLVLINSWTIESPQRSPNPLYSNLVLINFKHRLTHAGAVHTLYSNLVLINFCLARRR